MSLKMCSRCCQESADGDYYVVCGPCRWKPQLLEVTQPNGEPLPAPCAISGCQYEALAGSGEPRLRDCLEALVNKLEQVHQSDSYQGVAMIAAIHGFVYDGPTYAEELKAAKELLALIAPDTPKPERPRAASGE